MKKVIVVRSSTFAEDIRFPKIIEALDRKFEFTVLGWNRKINKNYKTNNFSNKKYNEILMNIKIPYGNALPFLVIWWIFVFYHLMVKNWDIVHIRNLDSAIPAIIASKIKCKKSIYEILDTYEDQREIPKIIRNFIIKFDKLLMSKSDLVILVDDEQVKEFNGIPNKYTIIYDSPPDFSQKVSPIKIRNKVFTIFHAGALSKSRRLNLENIFYAIKDLKDIKLILAGYGDMVEDIKKFEKEFKPKIKFIGKISYSQVLKYCQKADMMFNLRDPIPPINKYICGSTLFNAMMCNTPILINKGTSTAKKVVKEKCGLIIDAHNINEIKNAICEIRDNKEFSNELGNNGRKAYEKNYSWNLMKNKLMSIYTEIEGG